MTLDLQAMLTTLFIIMAYVAPIWLTYSHLQSRNEVPIGPRFYAAVIATLAVIAMNARVGAFLDSHITDSVGPLEPKTLVALFTAGAASLGISIFAWILPSISAHLSSLVESFRTEGVEVHRQSEPEYALDFGRRSRLRRGINFFIAVIGDVVAVTCGLIALAIYLLWPALPLAIDSQHKVAQRVVVQQEEAATRALQSALRSYSIDAGARANQLMLSLAARRTDCVTDACQAAATRRLDYVSSSLNGWKIIPIGGVFLVEQFSSRIKDFETAKAILDRIDELARQHRVVLSPRAAISPKSFAVGAEIAEQAERRRFDQNLSETGRQLAAAISNPARALSLIAADITMALAIGLELAAIALTLAANFRAQSAR